MIRFYIDGMMLPENPRQFRLERPGTNVKTEVLGIGDIVVQRGPGLARTTITSYFPWASGPESYVSRIEAMRESKKPVNLVVTDIGVNLLMAIEDFHHERRGGEHEDIYYDLSLSEYRPYGARRVAVAAGTAKPGAPERTDNKTAGNTYTVKSGDCLSHITKALTDGTGKWRELYELNKEVVGSNPNLIRPGQVLIIPEGW